ncbi:MAG: T9SS type A sorting domain-containing protein [Ignavibacteria bacterium]|jgi:M6 family metalloprotease-like protein|nr:T9SS type A sorting domain-containing protein [Ignavibacteria bacterium]
MYCNTSSQHCLPYSNQLQSGEQYKNIGSFSNLVVFIKFTGDTEFDTPLSYYDSLFNSTTGVSLSDYYNEVSYGQFNVHSYFITPSNNEQIISYTSPKIRNYFRPFSAANPNGYSTSEDAELRKNELLLAACKYIAANISSSINVDCDSNGSVDDITFIIKGSTDGWNDILWPQAGKATNGSGFMYSIDRHPVGNYIILTSQQINLGIVCHEFFHTLGAPDLYRYENALGINPVYYWDLMDCQTVVPQSMSVYLKYRYGNWIKNIPTIDLPGEYSLNPITKSSNNAYFINSTNPNERYLLEYRKTSGKYEHSLDSIYNGDTKGYNAFDGGLLVYRINKIADGKGNAQANANYPDELYLYRPDGNRYVNGKPYFAPFNAKYLRPAINRNTNPAPLLFDGSDGGLNISHIYEQDSILHFTAHFKNITYIKYPFQGEVGVSLTPYVKWDLLLESYIYRIQISSVHNFATVDVEGSITNDSMFYVKDTLLPKTFYYLRVGPLEDDGNVKYWSKVIYFETADNISIINPFSNICANDNYNLRYQVLSDFPANNKFTVLLSDKNGSFAQPINIGTANSNRSGTIQIHIPSDIETGHFYAIKIISSTKPDVISMLRNIEIEGFPTANIQPIDSNQCRNTISDIPYSLALDKVPDSYYKYEWQATNCQILSVNDTNISVKWDKLGYADINLILTNANGCTNEFKQIVYVNEMSAITFIKKDSVCPLIPITYYLPDVNFAKTTIEVINGTYSRTHKDSITIFWENKPLGYIAVSRTMNDICKDSIFVPITILSLPQINIIGSPYFCTNDTATYYISEIDANFYGYKWSVTNGEILGSNENSMCYLTSTADTIDLTLMLTDKKSGCSTFESKTISVFNSPEVPYITEVAGVLYCQSDAVMYKWYHNENEISNSNSNMLVPIDSGSYSVEIINDVGCSAISMPYHIFTSINDASYAYTIGVSGATIKFTLQNEITTCNYEIYDMLGRKIYFDFIEPAPTMNIPINLLSGFYFIKLNINNFTYYHKILCL